MRASITDLDDVDRASISSCPESPPSIPFTPTFYHQSSIHPPSVAATSLYQPSQHNTPYRMHDHNPSLTYHSTHDHSLLPSPPPTLPSLTTQHTITSIHPSPLLTTTALLSPPPTLPSLTTQHTITSAHPSPPLTPTYPLLPTGRSTGPITDFKTPPPHNIQWATRSSLPNILRHRRRNKTSFTGLMMSAMQGVWRFNWRSTITLGRK